jgi:integrase/recombinase XerD
MVLPKLRESRRCAHSGGTVSAALGGLSPIDAYEVHMRGAGRSERWIGDSVSTLRRIEARAGKSIQDVIAIDVSRFLASRAEGGAARKLSRASRAVYFRQINGFYRWWSGQGGTFITAQLPRPREPKSDPRPISTSDLERLLESRMHHRTYVMIMLAAFAGLRVHEIAQFRGEDIDLDRRTLRVNGKGDVTSILPLHARLVAVAGTMPRRGHWFPSNSARPGEHVHRRGVTDIIGDAMRRADVAGTPHALRHWFATTLLESGVDIRTVQELMRHACLETTARYTAVTDTRRHEAIDRLDPFGTG